MRGEGDPSVRWNSPAAFPSLTPLLCGRGRGEGQVFLKERAGRRDIETLSAVPGGPQPLSQEGVAQMPCFSSTARRDMRLDETQ